MSLQYIFQYSKTKRVLYVLPNFFDNLDANVEWGYIAKVTGKEIEDVKAILDDKILMTV